MPHWRLTVPVILLSLIGVAQPQPRGFTATQVNSLRGIGHSIASGKSPADINEEWKTFFSANAKLDPDSAIRFMLEVAKTTSQENVDKARHRVRTDSLLTLQIKTEKNKLLEALPFFQKTTTDYSVTRRKYDRKPGSFGEVVWRNDGIIRNQSELREHLKWFEERLNTVGNDAQLANVDLQNAMQQQQQTLQLLATISKLVYDTAMSIIRKIGG